MQYTKIRMMANDEEWLIVFYIDENGHSPVNEFLQSLDTKTQLVSFGQSSNCGYEMLGRKSL